MKEALCIFLFVFCVGIIGGIDQQDRETMAIEYRAGQRALIEREAMDRHQTELVLNMAAADAEREQIGGRRGK